MDVLLILFLVWCAFGGLGWYIAAAKGRPDPEGLVLGFVFGPLGCLIEALLPSVSRKPPKLGRRDRVAWMPDYTDGWDAPPEPKGDPVEDEVLGFLNGELGGQPREGNVIDLGAIADAEEARRSAATNRLRKR